MKSSKLYLIPTAIGEEDYPSRGVMNILDTVEVFFCERIRTTRRWLRTANPQYDIDSKTFIEYDKHKKSFNPKDVQAAWRSGKVTGLTSEAGMPAIADPGFQVVALAHQQGIPVYPLSGTNSLMMALMGSGLNGNQFTYHGYFPIKPHELKSKMQQIMPIMKKGYTQIFIETPYRNPKTFAQLLEILPENMSISLGIDLLNTNSMTFTKTVLQWKHAKPPEFNKLPCVFVLGYEIY